ncbi:MAG: DivIVA domain-containing protein [Microcella sp.]|uniref:DivIVA domain-containing protein n=1 Tax=Microcella sp. TaxID=1913979 RepID=UPI003316362F
MTSTFPAPRPGKPGYDIDEVELFLEVARTAYGAAPGAEGSLTSDDIRHTAFRVRRRGGYSARHVDAALERLEEAFAARERERAIAERGQEAVDAESRATAQDIVDRLARPEGRRFRRVNALVRGYRPSDVDAFMVRVSRYFQEGAPLTVENVRTIAFRPAFRGYEETQVDLLLDTTIRLMLAVR